MQQKRTAVLVAGGPLPEAAVPLLVRDARNADLLIGVDGGARHLRALGLTPHLITGDFDTLRPDELREFAAAGAEILPTPDQDYTDLDKALQQALGVRGAFSARVHAGTGGRLDHAYSVLSAIIKHGHRAEVRLVDEAGETWWLQPDREHVLEGGTLPGRVLSLLAFGRVTGVTTTGVRWPLTGEALEPGVRDGTLNETTSSRVTLRVEQGDLLVMLHHAPGVTLG